LRLQTKLLVILHAKPKQRNMVVSKLYKKVTWICIPCEFRKAEH